MKKKKQIAIITIIIMLLNMFFPYTSLFKNISYAGTGVLEEHPLIVNNLGITTKGSNRILKVELALVSEAVINGFDLQFKVDTTKLVPCNKNTGAETTSIGMISTISDYYMGNLYTREYDSSTNIFHFLATEPAGGTDIVENGYVPGETGDPAIDENGEGYPAYYPVITLSFKVVDDELTAENIPLDVFTLSSAGAGLPTGLKVNYTNETGIRVSKDLQLAGKGFVEPGKEIDSITVEKDPDNTNYEHGDTIDLTGGIIKVTYTDQSSDEIDMTNPGVSIKSGSPADVDNQTVTVEYKGKETSFNITVTDPIQSLTVSKPMDKIEYNHGDSIDFSGLELTVIKKSGATEKLTKDSQGVTTSEEEASVNSSKFTQTSPEGEVPVKGKQEIEFTYQGKTATQTIIVNDTISNIEVTSQPNKTIYKYGENLDLSGAVVKVTLASGAETNINLPDGSVQLSTYSNTTVGTKQNLSVTMKDKVATDTIDVEVYNYVTSSQLTEPIKVEYKYNEDLSVTGGRLRLDWADGDTTNVNLTTEMVTGYDKTKIDVQTLTVTYNFNYELSDGQQIPDKIVKTYEVQVTNPAKSIEITPPTKTEYNHGDTLDLAGGKIVVTYENNTTKDIQMTTDMIKEANGGNVNMSPSASEYTEYELSKVLKITYQEDDQTKTVDYPITIKNNVESIGMNELPTDTQYDINDTEYKLDGGSIKVTRAAGDTQIISLTDGNISLTELSTLTTTSGNKTVTVTYAEKTTTFQISVENGVKSIEITPPTKTEYNHGDTLDLAGGSIKVNYADGTSKNINLSEDMITETTSSLPVDMTPEVLEYVDNKLTKNLTITYSEDGITEKETYDITIKNPIDKIEIGTSPKTEYKLNESTVGVGGTIIVTRKAGNTETVDIQDSMVSNLSTATAGNNKTARITYTDDGVTKTVDYKYNVIDNVTSIEITPPTKTEYGHGDTLDLAGGSIKVNYASGTSSTVTMEQSMIKEEDGSDVNMSPSSYDSTNKVSKTLKITYEQGGIKETVDYPITIINKILSIEVQGEAQKEYNVNDEFQDNLSILVNRQTGLPEAIEVTEEMISGFRTDEEGTRTVTITYEENGETKTVEYEYTVTDKITSVVLKTQPNKTVYEYGDKLDLTGATIEVTKGSGKTTIPVTQEMVSGYNPEQLGDQELTVTYEGVEATDKINVTVNDKVIGIELTAPTKTKYEIGDELDLAGGKITTIMASGAKGQEIALTDDMVTGFDSKTEGQKELTVTYGEFSEKFTVTVSDEIKGIDLEGTPKTEYIYGEEFDVSDLELIVHKSSGDVRIPVTQEMIKGYDKTQEGDQRVTIEYEGQVVTELQVNVKNPVQKLEWITKPKTAYVVKDELDVTGGKIKATKADGTYEEISLTKEMVTGYDPDQLGNQELTVTYEGQTLTYVINVTDRAQSIVIVEEPKKDYLYGEELVAGGKIEVTKLSGEKETIDITTDMVSGYDPEQLGNQTLTITYGGVETTYEVNVKDYIKEVVITPPSKIEYNYGEDLDLSDAKVTIVMASTPDKSQTIPVTSNMISGYNPQVIGPQTVTITYIADGKNYTQNFGVTVADTIKSVTLQDTGFKTQYLYGENLDLDGLSLNINYSSGRTENIPVTSGMVDGYNPNQVGSQTLTITYQGFKQNKEVNVKDYVEDITLTPPTKTEYKIGESLSLVGGSITEKMASGVNGKVISLTQDMVKGFDSTTPGVKTITVTYNSGEKTFNKTFQVAVINTVNHIEVIPPTKTDYKYGEDLNLAGGSVKVVMEDGTINNVPITKDMVSGYQKTTPGQQMITVTYTDEKGETFTGYFNVTVGEDYIVKYQFTAPTKKEYNIGETIDLTGGAITEVYASGKLGNKIELTNSMISGFESSTPGTKNITVTYKENKYYFSVVVKDKVLGISIKDLPNKLEYKQGENLDLTGATLNVVKMSGTSVVNITSDMVSGYNPNQTGIQTITVTYEGFTAQFSVYVEKESTTPSTPEDNIPEDKPNIPSDGNDNGTNNDGTNNDGTNNDGTGNNGTDNNGTNNEGTNNKGTNNSGTNTSNESLIANENNENSQDSNKEDNQDLNKEQNNTGAIIGSTDNDDNNIDGEAILKTILNLIALLFALAGITLIIIAIVKDRKNVKIYLEEGNERVLVGKEKVTKHERVLDLNKYYNKYKEDKYKIVLSKSISKKLDKKTVNLIVHDKQESFTVDYNNKAYTYKT